MDNFDYAKAIEELAKLVATVEDPSTALDDIDTCIKRSDELVAGCREYLRTTREKLEKL